MIKTYAWIRVVLSLGLLVILVVLAVNYQTSVYLAYQAKGQITLLLNRSSIQEFEKQNKLSTIEKENLALVQTIKAYSVDSLGFEPTDNYTSVYDQKGQTSLWVITACEAYAFKPYEWSFPLLGKLSYKGFFKKELALREYNHLASLGYDVDIRAVSAWSTLGWFSDPLLSNMLKRSKGGLCNLLFHELFHATYYAEGSVDFNENIASFIAHKATLRFLKNDSLALKNYLQRYTDDHIYDTYILRNMEYLKQYYPTIQSDPNRLVLKIKALLQIRDSVAFLPVADNEFYALRTKDLLKYKNAWFVDFIQYNSMQDSLEGVFNKIYKGNIEKLVQDLKLN